jgi:hypothetical protein
MPKIIPLIDFFVILSYIMIDWYIKPYHLLVSPPFDVPVGISYGPPLTDPFKFFNKSNKLGLFSTFFVKTLLKTPAHL